MDITDAELDLISGYPSLELAGTVSPLSMTQSLNEFFLSLNKQANERRFEPALTSNIMAQQIITNNLMTNDTYQENISGTPSLNIQTEDLYFYPIKNFTCKKNERITLPLFEGKVDYKHLYTWEIKSDSYRPWDYNNQQKEKADDVWHCIQITNKLPIPLTTAPIEFISNRQIVGQNTITFTASGGSSKVKINKSMEFITNSSEKVVSQSRIKDVMDNVYMELSIEGELNMTNTSGKTVTVEITKNVLGQNIKAQNDAVITLGKNLGSSYNLNGEIKWTIDIQPKEKITLPYTYSYIQR